MAELITKQELIDNGVQLEKKLILINSSLYEKDAFEYLLDLVTQFSAMAFISDTHKIWTQGQYYGGDVFAENFKYWASVASLDSEDKIANEIEIARTRSILKFQGVNNVKVDVKQDEDSDAIVTIDYNLAEGVDKSIFTIDSQSFYHLDVSDEGKINVVKYTPINLTASGLTLLEHDSGNTRVSFTLNVTGTDPMTELNITANDENCVIEEYDITSRTIYAIVQNNVVTKFTIDYSDGTTSKSTSITQDWGYAIIYGNNNINNINVLEDLNVKISELTGKYITKAITAKTIQIYQKEGRYGWYCCPSSWKPVFTDASTNLQGGWKKFMKFSRYEEELEYQAYITENDGLGDVTWNISKK